MDEHSNEGPPRHTRRKFIAGLSSVAAAAGLAPAAWAGNRIRRAGEPAVWAPKSKERRAVGIPVVIFSKHLQWLDYDGMARMAAEMGFDGVDLTVRPRGHVLPDNVEEDLPRAVEAAHRAGLQVPTMTTAITDSDDPLTERVLKTASELGIRRYRMGYWMYDLARPIPPQLETFRAKAEGLANLNRHYGMCGDYQNHAGVKYVGASVWDLWEIVKDLDPDAIGSQFDARHATVEGATAWPVSFKLVAPRIHTVVAKDFIWRQGDDGWEPDNVPLGYGAVDFDAYFPMLKEAGFDGTVIVHYEYPLGGADRGAAELGIPEALFIEKVEADVAQVRAWISSSGLTN